MTDYTILIIFAVILFALLAILLKLMAMSAKTDVVKPVGHDIISEQYRTQHHRLELILALFGKYDQITNAIVRSELGFDDRVIVNYMDELEHQGKVKQIGKTGVNAHYILAK